MAQWHPTAPVSCRSLRGIGICAGLPYVYAAAPSTSEEELHSAAEPTRSQWCFRSDTSTLCSKKHVTTFLMIEVELSVYKDFWHTYYQEYRPSIGIFSFPPHLFRATTLPWETGQFTQQPSCTILLWQIEIFNQNHIFLWNFHDFV